MPIFTKTSVVYQHTRYTKYNLHRPATQQVAVGPNKENQPGQQKMEQHSQYRRVQNEFSVL